MRVCIGVCRCALVCMGVCGYVWVSIGVQGYALVCTGVLWCAGVCGGMFRCMRICMGVHGCVWDVFSEYHLETRVLTSANFNMYPIQKNVNFWHLSDIHLRVEESYH